MEKKSRPKSAAVYNKKKLNIIQDSAQKNTPNDDQVGSRYIHDPQVYS